MLLLCITPLHVPLFCSAKHLISLYDVVMDMLLRVVRRAHWRAFKPANTYANETDLTGLIYRQINVGIAESLTDQIQVILGLGLFL